MKTELTDKTSISRWKYALIFAGGTMFSRILGLVRDILIGWFVPDFSRDTFLFAFRLPNTLRDLLGEGAVNASFVPILSECEETQGRNAMKQLVSSLFSIMFLILLGVSLIGVMLMPFVPQLLGSLSTFTQELPKSEEQLQLTVRVLQWSFPYLFWIGIAVFMMAPLFVLGDYKIPGITPALLNIALIISIFIPYFFSINIIWSLVIGLWLGGISQAGVLYFEAQKQLGGLGFTTNWNQQGVKKAFILLIPIIFGQAAGEVNKLVDSFFSYSLSEGTVSALFYANRLIQLPLSIFGTAVSVSLLPELSRYFANKEYPKIRGALQEGLLQTLFMILPAMVMLMLLGKPIVQLLFERGHFGEELTQRTANAIFIYSIGVIGFSGVKVLTQ
ncbi:MAG: murein biosynthesis integral membrane protein MurJ, partial [Candidatus Hydrogenedens sp.]